MTEEEKGFVIKDRRTSSSPQSAPEGSENAAETRRNGAGRETSEKPPTNDPGAPLPEINFGTFVFSLNSSALVHLGAIEDPASGKREKDLPLAKQTIDILGMLEQKTRGNLTDDEAHLLKNILHDLRLMYVREKR